ncbi:hypothetical protein ABBQ38_013944 [Trebouxia sp. C0009 RCD-2024]
MLHLCTKIGNGGYKPESCPQAHVWNIPTHIFAFVVATCITQLCCCPVASASSICQSMSFQPASYGTARLALAPSMFEQNLNTAICSWYELMAARSYTCRPLT